jgi:hypothetical protein
MDQKSPDDLRGSSWWQQVEPQLRRVPTKAWVVLGLFLIAAILMAVHTASHDATLHLKVQHNFRSAQLSTWIDGKSAYSVHLTGNMRKRFGLIPDSVQGSVSQMIPVTSGKHVVRVRVEPEDGTPVEEITSGDFTSHAERDLSVIARRGNISLTWQANISEASSSSESGWLSRYAGSLIMTIAGSIISALTGYAIRELPGHLRHRQSTEPRA